MTIGTILLLRKITSAGGFYRKVLLPVSQASYGMYLSHMVILVLFSGLFRGWLGIGEAGVLGVWTTPLQIVLTALCTFITVAVLGVDVFCNRDRRLLGVEDKRSLSFGGESRVVAEQSPVTGIHGHLLVLKLAVEIETVVDAGAVADDQRRTTVSWRRQLSSCRRRREHKSVALSLLQLTCAVV